MIRLFHKELEAYLVAEGLFDEVVTEDGESQPFSFSHSPAPQHRGFKKNSNPLALKGKRLSALGSQQRGPYPNT